MAAGYQMRTLPAVAPHRLGLLLASASIIACSSPTGQGDIISTKSKDNQDISKIEIYDLNNSTLSPESALTDVERSCGLDQDNVVDTGDSAFALIPESDRRDLLIFQCLVRQGSYILPLEAIRRATGDGDSVAVERMTTMLRLRIQQEESNEVQSEIEDSLRRALGPLARSE